MKSRTRVRRKPTNAPTGLPIRSHRRRWALLVLAGLLLAIGGTGAVLEFIVWNKLPRDLVGKWTVVEGEMEGATFEFQRDGSMTARQAVAGNETVLAGRAEIDDRLLYVTTPDPISGQDQTLVHAIRVLTPRQLVLETEEGKLLKMERVEE